MFFWNTSRRTHELLPCGLQWRKLVKLFKKAKSKFYWYDFTVRGQRYRGSTNETKAARAAKVAGLKLAHVVENTDPLPQEAPVMLEFSRRFSPQWRRDFAKLGSKLGFPRILSSIVDGMITAPGF